VAKKKNIIKIHLESFQTFLINKKVNGKEVTPFLNKLSSGKEQFTYFPNFFHQTGYKLLSIVNSESDVLP
jgi:lipoteichoic acid synthase